MVEIREGRDEDRAQIVALARAVFGDEVAAVMERQWAWQWHDDPRLSSTGFRGPVAESDGRIVASTALTPAGLYVEGQPVEAWWRVDTMVHPDFRRRGIAAQMTDAMPPVVLGKGVTGPSQALLERTDYNVAQTGGFRTRTLTHAPRWSRATGTAVGRALGAVADVFVRGVPEQPEGVGKLAGDFDRRFDDLWTEARGSYACITRRDAAVLNWRYLDRPETHYHTLIHEDADRLRGYVVLSVIEKRGIRRGRIVDLLARRDDDDTRRDLVIGALRAMRACGADRVDCLAGSPIVWRTLDTLGFSAQASAEPLFGRGVEVAGMYVLAGDGD